MDNERDMVMRAKDELEQDLISMMSGLDSPAIFSRDTMEQVAKRIVHEVELIANEIVNTRMYGPDLETT